MKLSLKNVLIWAAGLFALVAFLFAFGNQLKYVYGNTKTFYTSGEILFGTGRSDAKAWLSFVGYLFILLAGLGAVAVSFLVKNEKVAKIVLLACAGVLVLGALMVFCVKANYKASAINEAVREAKKAGISYTRAEARADYNSEFANLRLTGMPVIAGILAMMGAAMIAVPQFVKLPDPFAKK